MKTVLWGAALLWAPAHLQASTTQDTLRLPLEQAVVRAVSMSPLVSAARGLVFAAKGERSEVLWPFPVNPRVEFGRIRRRRPDGDVYDFGWQISQEIELAGQSFLRTGAAGRRVRAADALVDEAGRLSRLDARLVYVTLHLAERRAALADSNAIFAERLTDLGREQIDAGEINLLEYNTAVLEGARARSQAIRAEAEHRAAAADLGRVLALPSDSAIATLALPSLPPLTIQEARLLGVAAERRPDLRAASLEVEAADKAVTAARLEALPNLTVAVFSGKEEGTDDLFGFSLGFGVPLFHRQQSAVGLARADREVARAVSAATSRLIQAEVMAAAARYVNAREAELRFAIDVLRAASENAALAARAFQEGELSIAEVVVFRSAAVATQLEYLEVLADAYQAWFELAAALDARPEELTELLGAEE